MALLASGWLLDAIGVCPSVKRIWTPAWVLFSGGWCFVFLAAFSVLLDTGLWGRWAYPLKVVGANSIAAYVAAHLVEKFIVDSYRTHFGPKPFAQLVDSLNSYFGLHLFPQAVAYEPFTTGIVVLGGSVVDVPTEGVREDLKRLWPQLGK